MIQEFYSRNHYLIAFFAILFVSLILFSFVVQFVWAAPLVPCGRQDQKGTPNEKCSTCHFFVLGQNISDFILKDVTPPLTIVFVVAGGAMILFGSGSTIWVAKGIGLLRTTGIGVALILGSWLIVNSALSQVSKYVGFSSDFGEVPAKWYTFPIYCGEGDGGVPGELICKPKDQTKYLESSNQTEVEVDLTAEGGQEGEYHWSIQNSDGTVKVSRNGNPLKVSLPKGKFTAEVKRGNENQTAVCTVKVQDPLQCGTCLGAQCSDSNLPICGSIEDECSPNQVNKLFENLRIPQINGLTQVESMSLLKSLAARLSGGNPLVENENRFGIFQFTVAKANQLKSLVGINESIGESWLTNIDNTQKIINLAGAWINSQNLIAVCGSGPKDVRDITAGFLGGKSVCEKSSACTESGSESCSICPNNNEPTKNWECLWSGPAPHNVCSDVDKPNETFSENTYAQIRSFAPRVQWCYDTYFK